MKDGLPALQIALTKALASLQIGKKQALSPKLAKPYSIREGMTL